MRWLVNVGDQERTELAGKIASKKAEVARNEASGSDPQRTEKLQTELASLENEANELAAKLRDFEAEMRSREHAGSTA